MRKKELSPIEKRRYEKHIMIPEIGEEGQLKLLSAKILVVGAGGLGCPVLQYLCAAGVGQIGIVEFDKVSDSNLHRQILYGTGDIGKLKSIITRHRLNHQNNEINIEVYNIRLEEINARSIMKDYDLVIDATDNYETRYLINDICIEMRKPMVHGAIYKFEGQVSVFNYKGGPDYRSYNPEENKSEKNPRPSDSGLIGVLPGITGTFMANEVIKIITGTGTVLSGKILIFNILNNTFYMVKIPPANDKQ